MTKTPAAFLSAFKNLYGSNQTLQAEMNCFTNKTKGTHPSKAAVRPVQQAGCLAGTQSGQCDPSAPLGQMQLTPKSFWKSEKSHLNGI